MSMLSKIPESPPFPSADDARSWFFLLERASRRIVMRSSGFGNRKGQIGRALTGIGVVAIGLGPDPVDPIQVKCVNGVY